MVNRFRWKRANEGSAFTGSCPVSQHTADGAFVGRCFHSTYGGRCLRHGDVSRWLEDGADLTDADDRNIERGSA